MRTYTSLEPITITDIGDVFFPISLTKEEFDAQKTDGTIYKSFVPPKDVTMLKFRYYTPDDILMEQNNVPIVYDGTAVVAVINYYKLSNENKGITFDKDNYQSDGWVKTSLSVTPNLRFLWKVTETVYSNGARDFVEPYIDGVYGDTGEKGDRGEKYLGHYISNQDAYTDNTPDLFIGDYYLNTEDKYIYEWIVDASGEYSWKQIDNYDNYKYSLAIDDIFATVEDIPDSFWNEKTLWVKNLIASKAFIDNLNTSQITLKNNGLIQSENYKSGSSGWKIDSKGNAEFNNATIYGNSTIEGLLIQGTKLYLATRIIISNYNGNLKITCSNPAYQGKVLRAGTGQFCILHQGFKSYGLPRILVNYCSDKAKSDRDIIEGYTFGSGDFSYFGTDPKYRLNCQGCGNFFDPDFMVEYYAFCFTDNNTDKYIDPVYADLLVYYI